MLLTKYEERKKFLEAKRNVILSYNDAYLLLIDESFNTITDIINIFDESDLTNPGILNIFQKVMAKCSNFTNNKEILSFSENLKNIATNEILLGMLK